LLRDAVDAMPELMPAIQKRNAQLEARGYHAQVHIEAETSLFFLLDNGRRLTLKRQNGSYLSRDRRFSSEELKDRADHLSPNALLRPVVQDYILPTVAYSGGPAELAYFAQSAVLYQRLLGRMPVVMPRSGFTLIDERARKLMAKYHLTLENALHGEHILRERIAQTLVPPSLRANFSESSTSVTRTLDQLSETLQGFDPTLAAALEKSRAKMLYQLSKLEGKASREAIRRDERAASDAAYISGLLFPEKHLQERLYSILPFLARHGLDLVDRVYENVHLECPDHSVLTL
jgi:bacillithiol biosynthesis cysteine-adding enzyme BshC